MFLILAQVHTVDTAPQMKRLLLGESDFHGLQIIGGREGHLESYRREIAFLQLLRQRPYGTVRDLLHLAGQISISCGAL